MYSSNSSDQQWSEIEHFFARSDPQWAGICILTSETSLAWSR